MIPKQSISAVSLLVNFLGYASLVEVPKEKLGALGFVDYLTSPNPE